MADGGMGKKEGTRGRDGTTTLEKSPAGATTMSSASLGCHSKKEEESGAREKISRKCKLPPGEHLNSSARKDILLPKETEKNGLILARRKERRPSLGPEGRILHKGGSNEAALLSLPRRKKNARCGRSSFRERGAPGQKKGLDAHSTQFHI